MSRPVHRRTFLRQTAAVGAGFTILKSGLLQAGNSPNEKLNIAAIGVGGRGADDLNGCKSENIVALCDVNEKNLAPAAKRFPQAKAYTDWRKCLDQKDIDAVVCATTDHTHAFINIWAMNRGKHVYCEKPIANSVQEARLVRETYLKNQGKLSTQQGTQIHASDNYRRMVELIRSGAIGKVKEVHLWTDRKWGDPAPVPTRSDPVPAGLNWDAWLGVCAPRPYLEGYYHPGNWRKRVDFGTGSLGDMGCHIFDPVFEALALGSPLSVRSEGPAATAANWALDEIIHYVFPATQYTDSPTVKLTWYDGDARPPQEVLALLEDQPRPGNGSIFIGTKGVMVLPHVAVPFLLPKAQFADYKMPKVTGTSHNDQFIDAVLGKTTTSTPFDYSGLLTETVLLGTVSTFYRNTTLEWDGAALQFKNHPEANARVRRTYRQGWEVAGLS